MNKFSRFVEWVWEQRDLVPERLFHPGVLTSSNDDVSLPKPPLSMVESLDLFSFMESSKLVFPKHKDENGIIIYSINKIEPYRWNEIISELKKPNWKRSSLWNVFCKSILLVMASIGGSVATISGDLTKDKIVNWINNIRDNPPLEIKNNPTSNSSENNTQP